MNAFIHTPATPRSTLHSILLLFRFAITKKLSKIFIASNVSHKLSWKPAFLISDTEARDHFQFLFLCVKTFISHDSNRKAFEYFSLNVLLHLQTRIYRRSGKFVRHIFGGFQEEILQQLSYFLQQQANFSGDIGIPSVEWDMGKLIINPFWVVFAVLLSTGQIPSKKCSPGWSFMRHDFVTNIFISFTTVFFIPY